MKNISRRKFIANSLAGLGAISLTNFNIPSSFAISEGSKSLIVVQLLGGLDPLLAFPYTKDDNIINSLRGNAARIPVSSNLLQIGNGLGVHPGLKDLFSTYSDSTKVMMQTGNAFNLSPNRSHEIATRYMLTGGYGNFSDRYAWTGRLYDNGINLQGLGGDSMAFNCLTCANPPLTVANYESFDISDSSFSTSNNKDFDQGGLKNAKHVGQVLRKLNSITPDRKISPVEAEYRKAQKTMFQAADSISEILSPVYRTSKYEEYAVVPASITDTHFAGIFKSFAQKFRNIAQKLNQLKFAGKSEKTVFVLSLGGFDLHDNWRTSGDMLMNILGASMKLFRDDLRILGVDEDVMTICTSEFGRSITGNGKGTDHGIGYTSFVSGGNVRGGVYGNIINPAELENLAKKNDNAWPREISQERILIEILEKHMGISGSIAFPSPLFEKIPVYGDFSLTRK